MTTTSSSGIDAASAYFKRCRTALSIDALPEKLRVA
jgi:hypothetical protein